MCCIDYYGIQANKISQQLEFYEKGNFIPILSHLFYRVTEFQGKIILC